MNHSKSDPADMSEDDEDDRPFVLAFIDDQIEPPLVDIGEMERAEKAAGRSKSQPGKSVRISTERRGSVELKGNQHRSDTRGSRGDERRMSTQASTNETTVLHLDETDDGYDGDGPPMSPTSADRQISNQTMGENNVYEDYKEKKITLHMLAREGDYRKIRRLLDEIIEDEGETTKNYVVNEMDEDSLAPLHYAARYSHYNTVKLLIGEGADVNVKGEEGIAPLHFAARYTKSAGTAKERINTVETKGTSIKRTGSLDTVKDGLGLHQLIEDVGAWLDTQRLAHHTHNGVFQRQSPRRPKISRQDSFDRSNKPQQSLGHDEEDNAFPAVGRDDPKRTIHTYHVWERKRKREDRHANSPHAPMDSAGSLEDIQTAVSSTPLDTENVVDLLVMNGADPNGQDRWGQTPLHFAAMRGNLVVANKLINCELIDIELRDVQGATPLHTTCTYSDYGIAELLLTHNANYRATDELKNTPLHLAASQGSADLVRLLFSFVNIDMERLQMLAETDHEYNTPLHLAVVNGHYDVVKLLLKQAADVNALRLLKFSPLHIAAANDDVPMVKLLLKHGAHIDVRNADNQQPMHRAAMYGNMKVIQLLHNHGADIECADKASFSPLLLAAREGHPDTVWGLSKLGADAFATTKQDQTAMHIAAEYNRLSVVKMLVRNHIGLSMMHRGDRYGNVPLHIAAAKGQPKVCKVAAMRPFTVVDVTVYEYLLDHGAKVDEQNEEEQGPLHLAVKHGHLHCCVVLLKHDRTIVTDEDEDSQTPLHVAAQFGHDVIVRCLLEYKSDVAARNNVLWTPLDIAAANGFVRTSEVLLKYNAPVDPEDKTGTTPLHLACMNGHERIVELLVARGANVNLLNKDSLNALDLAIESGHKEVVRTLINLSCWKDLLRNSVTVEDGGLNTPLRKLIRRMPDMAFLVFDKCMHTTGVSGRHDFRIHFDYEFVDDAYFEYNDIALHKAQNQENSNFTSVQANAEKSPFEATGLLKEKSRPYTDNTSVLYKHHPFNVMVDAQREHLLAHPLAISMLRHKWNGFGRHVYYLALLLYSIFVAFLSIYVVLTPAPYMVSGPASTDYLLRSNSCHWLETNRETRPVGTVVCRNGLFVLGIFHLMKEVIQIYTRKLHYISYENVIEWVVYIGVILFVFDFNWCQHYSGLRLDWQWQLGTVVVFLAWINLVLQIRKFPLFGIYVVMFTDILKTFSRFSVVFLLFIVAFALSFYTLFQDLESMQSFALAMMKTTVMMIGEFEYDSLYSNNPSLHYRYVSYSLFALFILMMTILIMNLLVGLAVDDIKGVQDQAALTRLAMTVELVLHVEAMIPERFRRRWVIGRLTLTPYAKSSFFTDLRRIFFSTPSKLSTENIAATLDLEDEPLEKVQKAQERLSRELTNVKHSLGLMQQNQQRIDGMLKALVAHLKVPYQDEMNFVDEAVAVSRDGHAQ